MNVQEQLPLVSIILPVYNVEKYVLHCLSSIDNQTYKNYEVLIIDDGSTDDSLSIVKNFCYTHDKFRFYVQNNLGSGPARNNGLDHAQGELIMFVDPDDWIKPDLLQKLYEAQKTKDYDFVVSRAIGYRFDKEDNLIDEGDSSPIIEEEILGQDELHIAFARLSESGIIDPPFMKLYKRSIIENCKVRFPNFRRSQDIVFNYRYFSHINSYYQMSYKGYCYRIIVDNAPIKYRKDYYKSVLVTYNDYKELYQHWNLTMPSEKICTFLFEKRINPSLMGLAYNNEDIADYISNGELKEIVREARSSKMYVKVSRFFVLYVPMSFCSYFYKLLFFIRMKLVRKM